MRSYVATPEGEYAKDTVILYCTDVFGPQLINSQVRHDAARRVVSSVYSPHSPLQLVADSFAQNGYRVSYVITLAHSRVFTVT